MWFNLWSQNDTWQYICESYTSLIKAHFSIYGSKFSFSPNEAARLMKFGENSETKQLIYYAQILLVDQ
jgi:hypothetical protein